MKPTQVWKQNKGRSDLRKFTREFQKKFKGKKPLKMEPGKVYAVQYRVDSIFPTDKHHFTPLIVSFGRFRDGSTHTRGVNLFYLTIPQQLELLEDVHRFHSLKATDRAIEIFKLHSKYMRIFPFAFKNLEELRTLHVTEILAEEWGMIPLLHSHLLGNFNKSALDADFQLENREWKTITKKKKRTPAEVKPDVLTEEILLEKDDTIDNFGIFEEDDI